MVDRVVQRWWLSIAVLWLCTTAAVAEQHSLPLFLPATAPGTPQGVLRVLNHSDASGAVSVYAIDDAGTRAGPVTFTLGTRAAAEFDAMDLANGNAAKGLSGSLGRGTGDWRLEIDTGLLIEPMAYVRAAAGTLAVMHDTVRGAMGSGRSTYEVPIFNPSTDVMQVSRLRLINPGDPAVQVTIAGRDDTGAAATGGEVQLVLPAGGSRTLTAQQLEAGDVSIAGRLGAGVGRWRLSVSADHSIQVVNMAVTPSGVWNNLSTTSVQGPAPADHRAFNARVAGLTVVYETDSGRFTMSPQAGDRFAETGSVDDISTSSTGGYRYAGIGPDAGRLTLAYDDGNACRANFYFASRTDGWFASHCTGTDHPDGTWLGGAWFVGDGVDVSPVFGEDGPGDRSYRTGTAIDTSTLPEASGGNGALRYTLSPDVPGLSFDAETGELSGTPTEAGRFAMTYTVTDSDGDTDTLDFTITVISSDAVAERDCYVGLLLRPGESCTYPGTEDEFSVNVRGRGRFLDRLAGIRIRIDNEAIGGRVYDFEASHQGDGVWRIDRVAGRTEPPTGGGMDTGTDEGMDTGAGNTEPPTGTGGMDTGTGSGDRAGPTSWSRGTVIPDLPDGIWMPDVTSDAEIATDHDSLVVDVDDDDVVIEFNSGGYIEEGAYRYTCAGVDGCGIVNRTVQFGPIVQTSLAEPEEPSSTGSMAQDRAVLEALYHATGGGRWWWRNDNWLSDAPLDQWDGVTTDSDGRVTGLHLADNRLRGVLPSELGRLDELRVLSMSLNELTGSIPPELGNLRRLEELGLALNPLTGPFPPELANLANLRTLYLLGTTVAGTVPWVLRESAEQGELDMLVVDTLIHGVGPPPKQGLRRVFSDDPAINGNASHDSVFFYQGPLVWRRGWREEPERIQTPVLGRWAAVVAWVDHDLPEPPVVITRVLDSKGAVLVERLAEAAPPRSVANLRTEYVFDLPGEFHQADNQLVFVIDPDDEMPETDETDNVSDPVLLYGVEVAPFRITFVPVHFPRQAAPIVDPASLMANIWAFWPIADDFEVEITAPVESDAADTIELVDEIRALWGANPDPNRFFHGIFLRNGPEAPTDAGGRAFQPGRAAVSGLPITFVIAHEVGHNLSLGHVCGAPQYIDEDNPYRDGGIGPYPGWDRNWRQFVSSEDRVGDIMTGCGLAIGVSGNDYRQAGAVSDYDHRQAGAVSDNDHRLVGVESDYIYRQVGFVSDYSYRKALEYWLAASGASGGGDIVSIVP